MEPLSLLLDLPHDLFHEIVCWWCDQALLSTFVIFQLASRDDDRLQSFLHNHFQHFKLRGVIKFNFCGSRGYYCERVDEYDSADAHAQVLDTNSLIEVFKDTKDISYFINHCCRELKDLTLYEDLLPRLSPSVLSSLTSLEAGHNDCQRGIFLNVDAEAIIRHCSKLRVLEIHSKSFAKVGLMAKMIEANPLLQRLNLPCCDIAIVRSMVKTCRNLESIEFSSQCYVKLDIISELILNNLSLKTFTALKSFHINLGRVKSVYFDYFNNFCTLAEFKMFIRSVKSVHKWKFFCRLSYQQFTEVFADVTTTNSIEDVMMSTCYKVSMNAFHVMFTNCQNMRRLLLGEITLSERNLIALLKVAPKSLTDINIESVHLTVNGVIEIVSVCQHFEVCIFRFLLRPDVDDVTRLKSKIIDYPTKLKTFYLDYCTKVGRTRRENPWIIIKRLDLTNLDSL